MLMTSRGGASGMSGHRPPQPQTSAAFADAAAFLERIGAARFKEAAEAAETAEAAVDDGRRRHRRQRGAPPPPSSAESLGRRLRSFLQLRPRRRLSSSTSSSSAAASAFCEAGGGGGELQDYEYTRWVFHRRRGGDGSSPERSASHDQLRSVGDSAAAAAPAAATGAASAAGAVAPSASSSAAAASVMTKSASARMVRFRCPYDSVSSSDQESTLISPYLTSSAFPCPPLPPGGSVSSGYSSDRETPPDATSADAAQHWVTREEDIDCLLLRRPSASADSASSGTVADAAATTAAAPDLLLPPDDLDVGQLDVNAYFFGRPPASYGGGGSLLRRRLPPPPLPQQQLQHQHQQHQKPAAIYDPVAADEIDRLVSEVVRLNGGGTAGRARQSWGSSWQRTAPPSRVSAAAVAAVPASNTTTTIGPTPRRLRHGNDGSALACRQLVQR